ncbi:unnamed protein product, partial [Amoebophrya sp. A25]
SPTVVAAASPSPHQSSQAAAKEYWLYHRYIDWVNPFVHPDPHDEFKEQKPSREKRYWRDSVA